MNEFDTEILVCPFTKDELLMKEKGKLKIFYSPRSNREYTIIDGIGVFLDKNQISKHSKKLLKLFEVISPIYDSIIKIIIILKGKWNSEDIIRKEIIKRIQVDVGANKILEVAIGTGANIMHLDKRKKYYGLDYSLGMLKRCNKKFKQSGIMGELYCGVAEKMPFRDNSFDITFCINGFMYFENIKKSIAEMIRVTKNGGKVVIINKTSWKETKNINKYLNENIKDLEIEDFFDNMLYMIRFRKAF